MDPRESTNIPGIILMVSGILNLLYAIVYTIWTAIGLVVGGMATIMYVFAALENPDNMAIAIISVLQTLSPIIQIIAYIVVFFLALITIFAGLRLRGCRSKGVVWLGALAAPGAPLLGIISSAVALCGGCGACVGFLIGNVGSIIVLVIGLVAFVMVLLALRKPEVAEAFANG